MFLILLSLLLTQFASIESCECPEEEEDSPQGYYCMPSIDCYEDKLVRHYCRSDFCIAVMIDSDKTSSGAEYKNIIYSNYTFLTVRTIRFTPSAMKALRMRLFFTPTEVQRCGVEPKRRTIYYMCGHVIQSNAVVTSCDFIKRSESLTFTERTFFLFGHKKINCFQLYSDFRPVIDHNIRQQFVTKADNEENSTRSELELRID